MKRSLFVIRILLIVGLAVPLQVIAQSPEDEPSPLADVWVMVPKPGLAAQFETALKAHIAFRENAGDSRDWLVFTPVIGHNLNVYRVSSCCFDWPDQDAYMADTRAKGFGENWQDNVDQYVDHYHHYLERVDWDNSHWTAGAATEGPYYGVTTWTWKEGVGPVPNEMREQFSQIAKNEGWATNDHQWLWLSRIGGEPKTMVVTSFADFADMAPGEQDFFEFIAEKVGSEKKASEMFTKFGQAFSSSDYTVWMYRQELSSPADAE